MRRGEAVLAAEILSVQPDTRLPVGAFQFEHEAFSGPLVRNVDILLIPGLADIGAVRLKPVGNLDLIRRTERCIVLGIKIGRADNAAGPCCFRMNGISDTLGL